MMVFTAAAMYGGAAFDGAIEGVIPGDPSFAITPVLVSMALVVALMLFGPLLSRRALAWLGPLGVVMIAYALSATPGAGDGAVLYVWPVLWMTFFFGRRGAIAIVACVGIAHAITLLLLPESSSYAGRWVDVMVSVSVVAGVIVTLVDRNDLLIDQLAGEARTDALTGLLNRRGFDERATLEIAHARREGRSIAVVAFDLDHFKRVNDEWGHDVGDRALAHTAAVLSAHSRDIDVVARVSGEEFVALLPGSDIAAGETFAERVRLALFESRFDDLPRIKLSAGVIAAVAPPTIESLLQGADFALYKAKRTGRDRTVRFEQRHELDEPSTSAPDARERARLRDTAGRL
jgi:diguanylate cyclase (GGDEF)-like protein